MTDADLRIDPLTGAHVIVTPWRQQRPNLPQGPCPFCPGGLEAPGPYDVRHFANRWPALSDGRHEVVLHSPDHDASFPDLGEDQAARVVELWSARTAALGSRDDVAYVFVFESRGRAVGATIDHPHSQILAFEAIPPIPEYELSTGKCDACQDPGDDLLVARRSGWQAAVPWAPSWPYELLISPLAADLTLLVIDTRARHALTDGQYATRRQACEEAASRLGVRSLRDVTGDPGALARLTDPSLRRLAGHVVAENGRVLRAADLLRAGDQAAMGELLTASHRSLRDEFRMSWPQADEAVEAAIDAGAAGARMTGGGFGGSVVALVPADRAAQVRAAVTRRFTQHDWPAPHYLEAVPSDGARRIG